MGCPNGELNAESRLSTVVVGCLVCREDRWFRTSGAAGKAEGFGARVLGCYCAMHADLTTGNVLFAITEDIGLDNC